MSRSKGRTSNSVSLFPFLAVLVCAMGALIFLLLVTTRRIRHNAVMEAIVAAEAQDDESIIIPIDVPVHQPETKPEVPAVPPPSAVAAPVPQVVEEERPDPNAKLEELIAALAQQRKDQQTRYEERRRLVLAAKSRISDSESQLTRLSQTFKAKQEERLTASVKREVMRAEFTRLGEDIDKTVVHLRRMEQEDATRSSKFAVVAFDGQSGTTRRPILIECTKNGLVFMQEEITLTAAHVDGFTIQNNPLLSGTRALMQYWRSKQQATENGQVDDAPYVLLIVRPGGSIAYYAARNMLMELAQDTGYELVEAEREIDVPPADPQATAACRQAIQIVLAARQQNGNGLISARRGADGVLRFKRGTAGFEPVEEEKSIYERAGQPGFGERRVGRRGGSDRLGSGNGRGNTNTPGSGRLASTGQGGNGGQHIGEGVTAGDGGRFLQPLERGATDTGGRPGSRKLEGSGFAGGQSEGKNGIPNGNAVGMIGTGQPAGNSPGDLRVSRPSGSSPSQNETPGNGFGQLSGGQSRTGESGEPQRGTGQFPAGTTGEFPGGGSGGRTNSGTLSSTARAGNQSGEYGNSASSSGSSNTGTANGGSGNGGSQSGGSPGTPQMSGPQLPMPLRTFGRANGAQPPTSGSRPTSRGLGISQARNGIGFERETKIRVSAETIRVGNQPDIDIARFKTYDELRERVLDDLDRHARTWGAPPRNFHWVPVVRFLVSPGGNLYYERLHGPLRKVGISSSVEYPLDTPAPRRRIGVTP